MESPDDRTKRLLAEAGWAKRLAYALVRNADLADDVAQDTLLAALQARPTSAMQEMRAWLQTTMRRIARRTLAQQQRRADLDRGTARPNASDEEQRTHERLRLHHQLCAAVESLPEPYRTAVWLRFVDGLSPRAVARRLDVTSEVVRQRVHRGLAMLRERLDREFGDRRAWVAALPSLALFAEPATVLAVLTMKKALVAAAVVLVASSIWILASPSAPDVVARQAAAAAPVTSGADLASDVSATTNTRVEERVAGGAASPETRGFEVLVVDKETDTPVAGAEVAWYDETAWPRMDAARSKMEFFEVLDFQNDQEGVARRFGWRTKTLVDGTARIQGSGYVSVFARLNEHFGSAAIPRDATPQSRCRIEIAPDRNLLVQVLDADGKPAQGAYVIMTRATEQSARAERQIGAVMPTVGPDGVAHFRHLQRYYVLDNGPLAASDVFRVRLEVRTGQDAGVPFDWLSPPKEPLILHLPACARVLVRAERNGRPLTCRTYSVYQGTDANGGEQEHCSSDGWGRFAHVPCGQPCTAVAWIGAVQVRQEFTTPLRPQELRVAIPIGDDHAVFTGRLLQEDHRPLANAEVHMACDSDRTAGATLLTTDDDGRFCFALPRDPERLIHIKTLLIDCNGMSADLGSRNIELKDVDFGDVILRRHQVLASGCFVEGATPYDGPMDVVVERQVDAPRQDWQTAPGFWPLLGKGSFQIVGPVASGHYRLLLRADELLPVAPVEFDAGAKDLSVQVRRGATLEASARVPSGYHVWGLVAYLDPLSPQPHDVAAPEWNSKDRLAGSARRVSADVQSFTWVAQPPGEYRLEFRLWGDPQPLTVIDNIHLPLPAGGDPRLRDVDLHDRMERLSIRLLSPSGEPLKKGGLALLAPRQSEECVEIGAGECEMLVRPGPVDLLVTINGYRPTEIHGARGQVDVTVQPWGQVQLTFPEPPEIPAGAVLEAFLQSQDAESLRYRTRSSAGSIHSLQPESEFTVVSNGTVTLTIGNGTQTLRLAIATPDNNKYVPVVGFTPAIQPSDAPIAIRIPPAALQAAIDKWNGGR